MAAAISHAPIALTEPDPDNVLFRHALDLIEPAGLDLDSEIDLARQIVAMVLEAGVRARAIR
ncbi:MAG TPA: hypothetical protein VFA12_20540 [Stellaceae bacterium]|nr:hypothetical protein [Stellaceae bacterium]